MKKTLLITLIITIMLTVIVPVTAMAADKTVDDLIIQFSTDKTDYSSGDVLTATVNIENTNRYDADFLDVKASIKTPEGFQLVSGLTAEKSTDSLKAGEKIVLQTSFVQTKSPVIPKTGDEFTGLFAYIGIGMICAAVIFGIVRSKKGSRKVNMTVVCVVIVMSLVLMIGGTVFAQENTPSNQTEISTTVKVNGKDIPVNCVITYSEKTPEKYNIYFDSCGGTDVSDGLTVTAGQAYGELPKTTRTGYTFAGWFTEKTGGTQIKADTVVTITDDQTLYAHWIANTYEVTFDGQVDGYKNQTIDETYDQKYILPVKSPIKTGYWFTGWYTEKTGGIEITEETVVDITQDTTVYAQWTPITYKTQFLGNYEGSSYDKTVNETYDAMFVLPETNPIRTGYVFAGWFTKPKDGIEITTETKVDASIRKAYAHWIDNEYYTMLSGSNWFSTLTSETEIKKTAITDIIFGKEIPTGKIVVTNVDLTVNETEKVKGYIVQNGDGDSYQIYIVGDYIFGNENCQQMFYGFSNLKTLDMGNFDTSNITDMSAMFFNCTKLPMLDLSNFNTSKVVTMQSMFRNCSALEAITFGTDFDTSKVVNNGMQDMFNGCSNLTTLDLSKFDTSKVINMNAMFKGCSSLTSLDLSKFDASKATSISSMFNGCSALEAITFGDTFTASNVTTMENMFNGCSNLKTLDLSKFDTSKVTNMNNMFNRCSKLASIDISKFNTSEVDNMSHMFNGCSNLTSLDLSKFCTSKVTDMSYMFGSCSGLETLNLSNFNVSQVEHLTHMFDGCSSLATLDLSNFDNANPTYYDCMFKDCSKLALVGINAVNDIIAGQLGPGWTYSLTDGAYIKTWGVIGDFNEWVYDVPMTETEPNVFVSPAIMLTTSNSFKVRYGADWTSNYGAPDYEPYVITSGTVIPATSNGYNMAVPTDGSYIVTLNLNDNTIIVTVAE